MKFSFLMLSLPLVLLPESSFALERELETELRRVDQRMGRINAAHEQMMQHVRQLQKTADQLTESMKVLEGKVDELTDSIVKVQNVDVANLRAGQKGLYDQIPLFTWGEDTEDCTAIGTKHQQTNTVKSEDGLRTLRFLCFDGKAIHLGTEFHAPPK